MQVQTKVQKRFAKKKLKPYRRIRLSVRVSYGAIQGVVFNVPHKADAKIEEVVNGAHRVPLTEADDIVHRIQALEEAGNHVDLPWNPAVLEQRIARAYRMGQKNPVHIYKLVTVSPGTDETIEERLLDTLAAKQDLADASINFDSDVNEVAMTSGMEDLKRRLEIVLQPSLAPVSRSRTDP